MDKKKLVILLSRFPYPLDKGDKLRAYHQIKDISNEFDIYLHCIIDEQILDIHYKEVKKYCVEINTYSIPKYLRVWNGIVSVIKSQPFQVGYFYSNAIHEKIKKALNTSSFDALYCQLSRMAKYCNTFNKRKVFDFQDAFSTNYIRSAKQASFFKKIAYLLEAKTMLRYEKKLLLQFTSTTIISTFDKEQLPIQPNNTIVISNGVDTHFFNPQKKEKIYDVLFCGNLNYLPNKEAAKYIITEIAPQLIANNKNIKIAIAGKYDKNFFSALPLLDNIHMLHWVEDIKTLYAQSKVFIAPLFIGAGLQNKLLEAMSMELPCITTNVANASLCANPQQLIIANHATEFCNAITTLLHNEEYCSQLGKEARDFVQQHYNWTIENQKLSTLLHGT